MVYIALMLAALLIAIPSACLVLLIRAERKREEMDRRYLKEIYGIDRDDKEEW